MGKRRQDEELAILERANTSAEAQRQAAGLGPSIYEQYWRQLDQLMDWMMADTEPPEGSRKAIIQDWAERRGRAQGIAWCLSIIGRPLMEDVDHVREVAVERWEARQSRKETSPSPRPIKRKARK